MSPEKQRIAIAKACGWRILSLRNQNFICPPRCNSVHDYFEDTLGWKGAVSGKIHFLNEAPTDYGHLGPPDYPNDPNAMSEAEKEAITTCKHWLDYCDQLRAIIPKTIGVDAAVSATAAQRAEAFLKTLGLWEDEK